MKRLAILGLLMPFSAHAASINTNLALGCQELSTQQSLRLHIRTGDADGYSDALRRAVKSKSCRQMPDKARIAIKERSGAFLCVKAPDTTGRCEWVEAKEVDQ